jgi:hypothetical protein
MSWLQEYSLLIFILFLISIAVNSVLIWYIKKAIERLFLTSENLSSIIDIIDEYSEHLKSVYELELFYGDETLSGLLKHTKLISAELKKYEKVEEIITVSEEWDTGE